MESFATGYQRLDLDEDESVSRNDDDHFLHILETPRRSSERWHHVDDLDEFFINVYEYLQQRGLTCICLNGITSIIKELFVVFFATFLYSCVNYDILFRRVLPPDYSITNKISLNDCLYDVETTLQHINSSWIVICTLVLASLFIAYRAFRTFLSLYKYYEISNFYETALQISKEDLETVSWNSVQQKLKNAQKELQMCISSQQINELDIHNRILRVTNYYIAMVNQKLLSPCIYIPFIGSVRFLTNSLLQNLDFIFFKSPYAVFDKSYMLNTRYKRSFMRNELKLELKRNFMIMGLINLIFSPFIFLWGSMDNFFAYAGVAKINPETLSLRNWSNHAAYYFRHYNEMNHDFMSRLKLAYKPAKRYMKIITPTYMTVISEFFSYIAKAVFGVLTLLAIIDEDVLQVEHVILIISICVLTYSLLLSFIPEEYNSICPEQELRNVLAHVHYVPPSWHGNAELASTRSDFNDYFQPKFVFILLQLLSPLLTPILLITWFRSRAVDFVDFFHNFTVNVEGVGDVCSLALLDVKRHGDSKWTFTDGPQDQTKPTTHTGGKTELSLINFRIVNPQWKPKKEQKEFFDKIQNEADRQSTGFVNANTSYLIGNQQFDLDGSYMPGYKSIDVNSGQGLLAPQHPLAESNEQSKLTQSIFLSMQNDSSYSTQMNLAAISQRPPSNFLSANRAQLSLHILYMHEMRNRKMKTAKTLSTNQKVSESCEPHLVTTSFSPFLGDQDHKKDFESYNDLENIQSTSVQPAASHLTSSTPLLVNQVFPPIHEYPESDESNPTKEV